MTLPCDEFELHFDQPARVAELAGHIESCPRCQLTQAALGLVQPEAIALKQVDALQARTLNALANPTRLRPQQHAVVKPSPRRFFTHAMAAGVGAFLASGAWLSLKAEPSSAPAPVVASRMAPTENEDNLVEEAVLVEVSWPDAEGY